VLRKEKERPKSNILKTDSGRWPKHHGLIEIDQGVMGKI
jgi:hypothetical protein